MESLSKNSSNHPLYRWFFENRVQFTGTRFKKSCYFIPAWKDVQNIMPLSLIEQYQPKEISPDACIFLEFRSDSKGYCRIHEIKSNICQEYPSFKANACLCHPERRYTIEFFNSQQSRTQLQMQFIKDLYGDFVEDLRAFDLMTLMLDHGQFNERELFQFLQNVWKISTEEFRKLLTSLEFLQLVKSMQVSTEVSYQTLTTEDIKKMADLFVNANENSS